MKSEKMVLAVGLAKEFPDVIASLKGVDYSKAKEVHIVNVFQTVTYTYGVGNFSVIFPVPEERNKISEKTLENLQRISQKILPSDFKGQVILKCLFGDSPKDKFSDYVKDSNADLVVVPTRKKHGFFESSFATYVQKHTQANLLIVKSA